MAEIAYKYSFKNDYSELAHPSVLQALADVGNTQCEGYGLDEFSLGAAELIKERIKDPFADVHFVSGGTQANMVVISSALRPYEAVVAPASGHIYMHEAGAIEATGHKVCNVKTDDGKLRVADIEEMVIAHYDEHMVVPRMVYISQSVENGTVYTKAELTALSACCRENKLFLYVDGARLGAAINSHACDLTYADIAGLADAFYIGGTKNGALFGEAIVICTDALKESFRYQIKQRGAMLAKGAAVGVQFEALFKEGLHDELARRANATALMMAEGIKKAGYGFCYPAETNQIFPLFTDNAAQKLHQLYDFYDWETSGEGAAVRLVTSWATPQSAVEQFVNDLKCI